MYRAVRSRFIRSLIKSRKWKDHDYIDSLIDLENFILNGPASMAAINVNAYLKKRYYAEWKQILRELRPDDYAEQFGDQKPESGMELREQEKEKLRQEWVAAGGKT
jgi:hypothetical protein